VDVWQTKRRIRNKQQKVDEAASLVRKGGGIRRVQKAKLEEDVK